VMLGSWYKAASLSKVGMTGDPSSSGCAGNGDLGSPYIGFRFCGGPIGGEGCSLLLRRLRRKKNNIRAAIPSTTIGAATAGPTMGPRGLE